MRPGGAVGRHNVPDAPQRRAGPRQRPMRPAALSEFERACTEVLVSSAVRLPLHSQHAHVEVIRDSFGSSRGLR
eukprot:11217543-Lingulodinium_polyedra.AAC.1